MREILFKAKRIDNGEWVEGYLYKKYFQELPHDRFVIEYKTTGSEYEWTPKYMVAEINPETLCQYTGLTDKNGNKIWENDVVAIKDMTSIGKVLFEKEYCSYLIRIGAGRYVRDIGRFTKDSEVIGNIFDNADLISEV